MFSFILQHLPGDSILDQIQATFLHENKEFEKISQTFGMGNYSRHDFCFNIQYGADKSFKDILAQISTKIQLIRTDGQVGYEGEMSLDMFSESEISTGAVRSVLMPFRCSTRGCENIFAVDVELSIHPSLKKSAGRQRCWPSIVEIKMFEFLLKLNLFYQKPVLSGCSLRI